MSLTRTDDFDGVTGIPQDVVETVVQRATATAAATDTTTGSAATSTATDFSSQLIKQTESHWSVSGTSVIAAWLACLAGGIMIILLFSYLRTKHEMIFLPRYRHLVRQETKNIVSRHQNNYHSLIPSSNPKADLETPEWETVIVEGEKKYRIKRAELDAPFWGWLRPAWHDFKVELKLWDKSGAKKKRDERILKTLGLDAYTMLEFLRLFRWLFALISIFVAIPLLCANYFINTQTEYGSTSLSLAEGSETTGVSFNNMTSVIGDLQLYTAANIKGDGLWVHVMAEWAVTLLVLLQVRIYAARHERAIESWSDMNRNEVSFKTIMLTRFEITKDIPIPTAKARIRGWLKLTKDERKLLIDLKQENMGPFYEKFEFWNETEHRRAGAAVQRIIDRQKRLAGVDQGVDDYGELQEGNDIRKQDEDEGLDVQGGCAWWNMDALKSDYHILREGIGVFASASESQAELREQEAGGRLVADVTAAFVTWSTARDAHTVLQRLLKDKDFRFKVERAPRNNCVIWRNLEKDPATLTAHRITGQILRLIITVVNSLPLLFITVLANLDALTRRWPRLQTLRDSSKFWEAVFTAAAGILPAGLAALFVLALPHLMRLLSHWQGALSRGQMDQDVIKQMFVFMLISKFVIFSLLGIGYETYLTVVDKIGNLTFTEIVESLGDVPAKVTKAYISQSSYWLSFFPIRSALTCLNLLQPARWVMKFWEIYIKREANTRDRWDEVGEPSDFEYAIEYTDLLFGMVVALVYTPLAPLIALCGTLYFWIASVVVQNQLTFVEKTVETDGKAWRVVMNRVLAGLACMQGLMILTVLLKTNPFATDTSSPLGVRLAPLIVSIFPLGVTFHLVQHVRTKKSAAEIITSSSSLLSSSSLSEEERQTALARLAKIRSLERKAKEGEVPKFEHEILNTDALKHINIFPSDLTYLVDGLEKARGGMTLKDGKIQAGWSKRVFWDARALIPQYGAYMAELEKTAEQRKAEEDAKRKKEEAERRREERKKREKEARERERKKREKRRKEEREAEERWRADEKRRREERGKKRLKEEERFREREKLKRELKQLKEQSEKKGRK